MQPLNYILSAHKGASYRLIPGLYTRTASAHTERGSLRVRSDATEYEARHRMALKETRACQVRHVFHLPLARFCAIADKWPPIQASPPAFRWDGLAT